MRWEEHLERVAAGAVLFRLRESRVFQLTGRDHVRYLHNRCTQEIKALRENEVTSAYLLTPNGRTQGVFTALKRADSFLLIVDDLGVTDEEFRAALLQFKVADDVQLEDISESYSLYSLQGVTSEAILSGFGIGPLTEGQCIEVPFFQPAGYMYSQRRGPCGGCDLLVPRVAEGQFLGLITTAGVPMGDDEGLEALRISAALPKLGVELTEKTVASDLPLEGRVSFRKGCYAGQETVEMATSRGKPNRELASFVLDGNIAAQQSIVAKGDGKSVGVLTSVLFSETLQRTLALGFVKYHFEGELSIGDCDPIRIDLSSPAETLSRLYLSSARAGE